MKNHTSKDAFYERLRTLAEVNKISIKESQNRTLGTLIDYKRAADNVAYGIIKENHHYYIKKGGIKNDPNISDFAYIGGLENITNYQYKSLAEADKQRNMLLHTINEAFTLKPNANGSKKRLNEDKAGEEIKNAEEKLDDLDAATDAEMAEPEGDEEMAAGLEAEPEMGGGEMPEPEMGGEEMPEPEGGEEMGGEEMPEPEGGEEMGGEEMPEPEGGEEMGGEELPAPEEGEEFDYNTLKKYAGKLAYGLSASQDLSDEQIEDLFKAIVKQGLKDRLPEMDIIDRKRIAKLFLNVVPEKEKEDLSASIPQETGEIEEERCSECGSFAMYAESRGYNSAEALMECGEEEVSNLVSGYANAHNDGMNDGDLDGVALVIKVVNPEILNKLKSDYGHEEYADKLEPQVNSMSEATEEESVAKLNELFGSFGAGVSRAAGGLGKGVADIGRAAMAKAKEVGGNIKQDYYKGVQNSKVDQVTKLANELKGKIEAMNAATGKAGGEPIAPEQAAEIVGNIIKGMPANISKNVGAQKAWNIGKKNTFAGQKLEEEGMTDPAGVQTQSLYEKDEEIEKDDEVGFAPAAQTLGAGVVKAGGAPTTITVTSENGTKVDVGLNEVFRQLKKAMNEAKVKAEGNAFTAKLAKTKKGGAFELGNKKMKDTSDYDKKAVEESKKPSAGLSKEKKSEIVKKAKKGEDIGKKGKGFEKVEKAAEKGGAKDPKAVAAAAMWKSVKREGAEKTKKKVDEKTEINESEVKLRKYIRTRLEEKAGLRKASLNESKKSEALKKLDEAIDKQFESYKTKFLK
jgi:hypothetical protein